MVWKESRERANKWNTCIVKTLVNASLHFINHCVVNFTAKAIDDSDVKVLSALSIFDAFTDIRATLRNFRRNIYHVQFCKLRSRSQHQLNPSSERSSVSCSLNPSIKVNISKTSRDSEDRRSDTKPVNSSSGRNRCRLKIKSKCSSCFSRSLASARVFASVADPKKLSNAYRIAGNPSYNNRNARR